MALPEVWSDLHHNILHDSRGAIKKVVNIDSVVTSIDNILGTYQGERVMLPEFASKLKDIVFEPIRKELMDFIGDEVKRVIERWDTRVNVTGVQFFSDPDRSYIEINVSFKIRGYDQIFQHSKRLGGI